MCTAAPGVCTPQPRWVRSHAEATFLDRCSPSQTRGRHTGSLHEARAKGALLTKASESCWVMRGVPQTPQTSRARRHGGDPAAPLRAREGVMSFLLHTPGRLAPSTGTTLPTARQQEQIPGPSGPTPFVHSLKKPRRSQPCRSQLAQVWIQAPPNPLLSPAL